MTREFATENSPQTGEREVTEQHVRAMQSRMMELRCEGIMARLRGDSEEANYCRASADFLAAKVLEP